MLREIYIVQEDTDAFAAKGDSPEGVHLTDGETLEDVIFKAIPYAEAHDIDVLKVYVCGFKGR